ncbi:MAG: GNAT family N-acetyltransferase [Acidimicrobiaceae bacterium]|nr:GNAT family N-acetyltransferase [Acidimicrobiaceae bacterium]
MIVRQLQASEVDVYRSVRLRALKCDPAAFESSCEREAALDDATWRSRLASFAGRPGAVFVVDVDGCAEAMMGIGQGPVEAQAVVWGMWVAPAFRRRGYGEQLLAAGLTWARDLGLESISLEVFPANTAAAALYRAAGFRPDSADDAPADPRQAVTLVLPADSPQARHH